jgi:hypothetical protein
MDRVVRVFNSFEDAEQADRQEYAQMTPQERLDLLLDLIKIYSDNAANQQRLARVHRVVELSPG